MGTLSNSMLAPQQLIHTIYFRLRILHVKRGQVLARNPQTKKKKKKKKKTSHMEMKNMRHRERRMTFFFIRIFTN